jgi:hypothetical protein
MFGSIRLYCAFKIIPPGRPCKFKYRQPVARICRTGCIIRNRGKKNWEFILNLINYFLFVNFYINSDKNRSLLSFRIVPFHSKLSYKVLVYRTVPIYKLKLNVTALFWNKNALLKYNYEYLN